MATTYHHPQQGSWKIHEISWNIPLQYIQFILPHGGFQSMGVPPSHPSHGWPWPSIETYGILWWRLGIPDDFHTTRGLTFGPAAPAPQPQPGLPPRSSHHPHFKRIVYLEFFRLGSKKKQWLDKWFINWGMESYNYRLSHWAWSFSVTYPSGASVPRSDRGTEVGTTRPATCKMSWGGGD